MIRTGEVNGLSFKLLAMDLDDTLLNENFKISVENREAIQRAAKMGVLVTLATGRMFVSTVPFARELQIDLPLITYHGALIRTVGEETLYHQPVPLQLAKKITELSTDCGFHVNVYIDDELYVAEENEYSGFYQRLSGVKVTAVGDLSSFLQEPPTKLTIIDRKGRLKGFEDEILKYYGDELSITLSRPHFLEITDRLSTKGQALKFLAGLHGIPREQVAAVGDSYNDMDMLVYAGIGVAVSNARQEVKDVADVITASNVENGVAQFIEKYLFKGKGEE